MRTCAWLLLAAGLLAGCQVNPGETTTDSGTVQQRETLAMDENSDYFVWSALLALQFPRSPQLQQLVVYAELDTGLMPGGGSEGRRDSYLREHLPQIEDETIDDFYRRLPQSRNLLADHFLTSLLPARLRLVTSAEMAHIFGRRGNWEDFHRAFPGCQGVTSLSVPGYNSKRTQALLHISTTMGPLAGSGRFVLLALKDGTWFVVGTAMTWIS